MRWLIGAGGLALAAMVVLIIVVLMDNGGGPEPTDLGAVRPAPPGDERDPRPVNRPANRVRPAWPDGGLAMQPEEEPDEPIDESSVDRFGQEFERKWKGDRERLGVDRHREMEKLWFEGRRPRGDPASIEKLERLLREYPDTNRAGCAAMELGHHFIRGRDLDLKTRREKAAEAWRLVESRYSDTLCEYNAPAAGLSKLALVSWVYRFTDPGMARRLLEEILAGHEGETDRLGRPLQETAAQILERL
jgi:hypothetical protein